MSDLVDQAQDAQLEANELAIGRALANAAKAAKASGRRNCMECREPIGEARLKRIPAATSCVRCATEAEHNARHYARRW